MTSSAYEDQLPVLPVKQTTHREHARCGEQPTSNLSATFLAPPDLASSPSSLRRHAQDPSRACPSARRYAPEHVFWRPRRFGGWRRWRGSQLRKHQGQLVSPSYRFVRPPPASQSSTLAPGKLRRLSQSSCLHAYSRAPAFLKPSPPTPSRHLPSTHSTPKHYPPLQEMEDAPITWEISFSV